MRAASDFDVRDLIDGVALLAATANVIMQLARPGIGYGVLENSLMMRHPIERIRNTVTYLSVALMRSETERAIYRRQVNRSHAGIRSGMDSPVVLYRGVADVHALLHGP